jgi:hypothetical protein
MGKVERAMVEAMLRLIAEHGCGVTEDEAISAIVPDDRSDERSRPKYRYCFRRLSVRGLLNCCRDEKTGEWLYRPNGQALRELERGKPPA